MNSLLVAALPQEIGDTAGWPNVLFTGVGKVNAAYALTSALLRQTYDLVINVGTAGSYTHKTGEVIVCTRFAQRDMDVSALGFPRGVTPFSTVPTVLESIGIAGGLCASGDSFVTSAAEAGEADALDMEAYALASVCLRENVPFACVKYITDGADHNASADWTRNQAAGSAMLLDHARRIADSLIKAAPAAAG